MLHTTKRIKYICYTALVFIHISCKNENNIEAKFYHSGNESTSIVEFYSYKNGTYIHLIDEQLNEKLSTQILDSINFIIADRKYIAKPIDILFSRNRPNSDFYYPVFNKTKKIEVVILDNKKLVSIGSMNTDLNKVIKSEAINILEIKNNK